MKNITGLKKRIIAFIVISTFLLIHATPLKLVQYQETENQHAKDHKHTDEKHSEHESKHPCCINNTFISTREFSAGFISYAYSQPVEANSINHLPRGKPAGYSVAELLAIASNCAVLNFSLLYPPQAAKYFDPKIQNKLEAYLIANTSRSPPYQIII